jgi:hypothetical protein
MNYKVKFKAQSPFPHSLGHSPQISFINGSASKKVVQTIGINQVYN